jgi:hypothetical protein
MLLMLSFVSTVSGNVCVICAAGKYRFGRSSLAPCLHCPANTFSAVHGASACQACPMHTFSAPGSALCEPDACVDGVVVTGCLCVPGSTGDNGGPCTACGRDTFKNRTGSSACLACAPNETSANGSVGCVCEENYFGVSGDCAACPLELVSPQNSSECFCGDGGLLSNGTCAVILPVRVHLTGVFGDDTNAPMTPAEVESATAALVQELSKMLNVSADTLDVTTWTDANDTTVRYSAQLSWTGVFPNNTNASDAMTDGEIEAAKGDLVLELVKVYNTNIGLTDVKTWTDGNSTSVRYSVNISWTGVFPEPARAPHVMTDGEIEAAKGDLVLELAKVYNTNIDLPDVKTWTDGNSTSVSYSVNISWTGVFPDPPRTPHVMPDDEIEAAKGDLVLELAKVYNTNIDLPDVKTWTDANSTSVHYSVNISWNGVFEDTNSSTGMSPDEIEGAKQVLILELAKTYNTSADLVYVHTWTDVNDTSVHYKVEILTTGVLPAPPRAPYVMTDVEIEDAKTVLRLELAKVYNTTTDLLDVTAWSEGNETSVRYRVKLLVTGALKDANGPPVMSVEEIEAAKTALLLELATVYNTSTDLLDITTWSEGDETSVRYRVKLLVTGALEDANGPHVMSAEEIEAAKKALALEVAKLYNTTTDFVHVSTWTDDNGTSVQYRVNVSWTGAFDNPADPPYVMSAAEIEAAKQALVLELAKLYNTSAHLVEVETWTDANGTRVHVSVYIFLDGPESLNVTGKFPLLTQVKVDYEYGQIVHGKFRQCPMNMRVVNGSCECVAGYHERDGVCEACSRGTYKEVTANTECLECAGNTYSGAAAGVCSECPPFAFEIEAHTRCVCRDGFILFRNECVEQQPSFVTLEAELRHNGSSLLMLNISTKLIASISSRFDIDATMLFVTVDETSEGVYLAPAIEATTTPTPTSSTTAAETTAMESSTPAPVEAETAAMESSTPAPVEAETAAMESSTPAPNNESQAAGRRLLQLDTATRNDTTTPRPPDYFVRRITIACVCPEGSAVCEQCLALQDECYALEDTEFCGKKSSGVRRVGYVDYTGKLNVCAEGQVLQTDLFTRSKVCADKSSDAIALWMILLFVLLFVILISALGTRFKLHHMIYVRWMPRGVSDGTIHWKGAPLYEKVPLAIVHPVPERPPPYRPPDAGFRRRETPRGFPTDPTAPPLNKAYALYELHFNK